MTTHHTHVDEEIIERTPEQLHYHGLLDAFISTVEELCVDDTAEIDMETLKRKLASQYYALIECDQHNGQSLPHVCEAVIDAWGISRKRPISREAQKMIEAKYEAEYLQATEIGLIEAENALRMPRLSKVQRQMHEDDVTFYGAELVCHERGFKSPSRRRACTKLIEEHKVDRTAPLQYHRA